MIESDEDTIAINPSNNGMTDLNDYLPNEGER